MIMWVSTGHGGRYCSDGGCPKDPSSAAHGQEVERDHTHDERGGQHPLHTGPCLQGYHREGEGGIRWC